MPQTPFPRQIEQFVIRSAGPEKHGKTSRQFEFIKRAFRFRRRPIGLAPETKTWSRQDRGQHLDHCLLEIVTKRADTFKVPHLQLDFRVGDVAPQARVIRRDTISPCIRAFVTAVVAVDEDPRV